MLMLTRTHRRVCRSYETDIRYLQHRLKACEATEDATNDTRLLRSLRACREVAQGIMHPGSRDGAQMLKQLADIERLLNDLERPLLARMTDTERTSWGLAINKVPVNPAWRYPDEDERSAGDSEGTA